MAEFMLKSDLRDIRQELVRALKEGKLPEAPERFRHIDVELQHKYKKLRLRGIIKMNATERGWADRVIKVLEILIIYGVDLLKPTDDRRTEWNVVKFEGREYQEVINPVKGGRQILVDLGYSEDLEDGIYFPEDREPDKDAVAGLTAELMLAKDEMTAFNNGAHPHHDKMAAHVPEPFRPVRNKPKPPAVKPKPNVNRRRTVGSFPVNTATPSGRQHQNDYDVLPSGRPRSVYQRWHPPAQDRGVKNPAIQQELATLSRRTVSHLTKELKLQGLEKQIESDSTYMTMEKTPSPMSHARTIGNLRPAPHEELIRQGHDELELTTEENPYVSYNPLLSLQRQASVEVRSASDRAPDPIYQSLSSVQLDRKLDPKFPGGAQATPELPVRDYEKAPKVRKTDTLEKKKTAKASKVSYLRQFIQRVRRSTALSFDFKKREGSAGTLEKKRKPSENQTPRVPMESAGDDPTIARTPEQPGDATPDKTGPEFVEDEVFLDDKKTNQAQVEYEPLKIVERKNDPPVYACLNADSNDAMLDDEAHRADTGHKQVGSLDHPMMSPVLKRYFGGESTGKSQLLSFEQMFGDMSSRSTSQNETVEHLSSPITSDATTPESTPHPGKTQTVTPDSKQHADIKNNEISGDATVPANTHTKTTDRVQLPVVSPGKDPANIRSPDKTPGKTPTSENISGQNIAKQDASIQMPNAKKTSGQSHIVSAWQCRKCESLFEDGVVECPKCSYNMKTFGDRDNPGGQPDGEMTPCPSCTFLNPIENSVCDMCYKTIKPKEPTRVTKQRSVPLTPSDGKSKKICPKCTAINASVAIVCGVCESYLPLDDKDIENLTDPVVLENYARFILEQCSMTGDTGELREILKMIGGPNIEEEPVSSEHVETGIAGECSRCTYINSPEETTCSLCGSPLPDRSPKKYQDDHKQYYDVLSADGKDTIAVIKEGDRHGFSPEETVFAVQNCGAVAPIDWLRKNYQHLLDDVIKRTEDADLASAQRGGEAVAERLTGITVAEARGSMMDCTGDVEQAVQECINIRLDMIKVLSEFTCLEVKEIQNMLMKHNGDIMQIYQEATDQVAEVFTKALWDGTPDDDADGATFPTNEVPQKQYSVPENEKIVSTLTNRVEDKDRRIRLALFECKLPDLVKAAAAVVVLEQVTLTDYVKLSDVLEAVCACSSVEGATAYLQKECQSCLNLFPMNNVQTLNTCECIHCEDCLVQFFSFAVKSKQAREMSCPVCSKPDLSQKNQDAEDYFWILNVLLQSRLPKEDYQLFEQKIRDWNLADSDDFRWCSHCDNGFMVEDNVPRGDGHKVKCPKCNKYTCVDCKKRWEEGHHERTCDEYEVYLARVEESGDMPMIQLEIRCPKCKMLFHLERGGCMHITCKCKYQFCEGCLQEFTKNCTFPECSTKKGLHCHHPRDCLYYLRDLPVKSLQTLLNGHDVEYNTEGSNKEDKCQVMERKESGGTSYTDEACGNNVEKDHAGFCEKHYKEYLIRLINRERLDPVDILEIEQMKAVLSRHKVDVLEEDDYSDMSDYTRATRELIQHSLPLK